MEFGTQIETPTGFGSLRSGERYYFAGCRGERVLVVWFASTRNGWRVYAIHIERCEFESALQSERPLIRRSQDQHSLPPWLWVEGDLSYDDLEGRRKGKPKKSYREQTERRLLSITPALALTEKILAAERPLAVIAEISRKAGITEHPHRLQQWFFAKILHPGAGIWALKKPSGRIGRWSRTSEKHKSKKLGRPSLANSHGGYSTACIREKILKAYENRCEIGKYMSSIHSEALIEDFGCITVKNSAGVEIIIHPQNEPFPTYGQFRYIVVRKYNLEKVQRSLYGDSRIRSKKSYDDGSYKSQFSNLLEEVQLDAYFVSDRPRSVFSNQPMPRLAVVRAKCTASAAIIGVGFSLEGEAEEAYRAALFCAAVPKGLICRLYGLDPKRISWDMQGLPPTCLSDRGPPGTSDLILSDEDRFSLKSLAPSYAPKSKASVESSHPRSVKLEGKPTYFQTNFTVPKMMKKAVFEAVRQNNALDISSRLTDVEACVFIKQGWAAVPQRLWEYRTGQMRTLARLISVEQAVRLFLTPLKLSVDRQGVKFRTHWYSSNEFRTSEIRARLADRQSPEITGYAVPMTLTIIWVEVSGRLLELTPHKIIRCDDDEYEISVFDAKNIEDRRAELASLTRQAALAAEVKAKIAFKEATGQNWSEGRRLSGKVKRATGAAGVEACVTKGRERRPRRGAT